MLALAEIVADKLTKTPSRTSPPGLIARILMGGLSDACVAAAGGQSALAGAVLGAVGGVAGCYAGLYARTVLVRKLGTPDWPVALVEDLIAVGGSLLDRVATLTPDESLAENAKDSQIRKGAG